MFFEVLQVIFFLTLKFLLVFANFLYFVQYLRKVLLLVLFYCFRLTAQSVARLLVAFYTNRTHKLAAITYKLIYLPMFFTPFLFLSNFFYYFFMRSTLFLNLISVVLCKTFSVMNLEIALLTIHHITIKAVNLGNFIASIAL